MKIISKILLAAVISLLVPGHPSRAQEMDIASVNDSPVSSVAEAVSGLLPWVSVNYTSDMPGAKPVITLRGEFSQSLSAPLILVDGVEMPLELLDPSVVERVEVLRDVAAVAVYGARAAAGAILVTTKNAGKYNSSGPQAGVSANAGAGDSGYSRNSFNNSRFTRSCKVEADGGDDTFSYLFAGNYYAVDGPFSKSFGKNDFNKLGFTANMNARVTGWLHYSLGVNYVHTDGLSPFWGDGDAAVGMLQAGSCPELEATLSNAASYSDSDSHYALLSNRLRADIAPGLDFSLSYSFSNDYGFLRERSCLVEGVSQSMAPDFYGETRVRSSESDMNARLHYNGLLAGPHSIDAALGTDIQSGLHKRVSSSVGNLLDPHFSVLTIGDDKYDVGERKGEYLQCGFFATGIYRYKNLYSAGLTFREDGSSRLPSSHRWSPSVAASLGWTVTNAESFRPLKNVFDRLEVRYGISSVANQRIVPLFAYYSSVNTNAGAAAFLSDRSGLGRFSAYDFPFSDDLKAERVLTNEIAADASMLGGRLNATLALYSKYVEDMINPAAVVSAMLGSDAPLMNQGDAFSLGIDLLAVWSDTKGGFRYNVSAGFSDHTSSLKGIPDPRSCYTASLKFDWRSWFFASTLDGVGSYGSSCLRNVTLGHSFDAGDKLPFREVKASIAARNIRISGLNCPMWLMADVKFNF